MVEQGGDRRTRRRASDDDVVPSIHSFPPEVIVNILARVANHSLGDLFNAKLSCKEWNELGDDSFVYKHASVAKFPIVWWDRQNWEYKRKWDLFLHKCVHAGNLEALYTLGVVDYWQSREPEYALGRLKKAANAGHIASLYAFCVISIFLGDKDGIISVLGEMMKSMEEVRTARQKLKNIINELWPSNLFVVQKPPICCTKHHRYEKKIKNGWEPIDSEDEDSSMECKPCKCDLEISRL